MGPAREVIRGVDIMMNIADPLFAPVGLPVVGYSPAGPSWYRLDGFSESDRRELAIAFPEAPSLNRGRDVTADPMMRFALDTRGRLEWVPPILSCGYHEASGISIEIDPECGGGFVTRPLLPHDVAAGDVMPRLVRHVLSIVPLSRPARRVDVHAARILGGPNWTKFALSPSLATAAILIHRPDGPLHRNRPISPWGMPKLRRPFETLVWSAGDRIPSPDEAIDGGSADMLIICARG
jgi:hypothetical protein